MRDEPAFCVKYFPCFQRNINIVFLLLHVALMLLLCPSERMTPSSSMNAMRFLLRIRRLEHKLVYISALITTVSCSVHVGSCSPSPLPSPPLHSLLIHGLSAVLNTNRGGQGDGSHFKFFFYSGIKFFGFCFSLKMRPQCLPACFLSLLLHHARSDGWFHHPSCFFYFLLPESGIIRL